MKRTVKVIIEECVSQEFIVEVEAEDIDETLEQAMEIAEEKYDSGEFVLDNAQLSVKNMMAECGDLATEWTEF